MAKGNSTGGRGLNLKARLDVAEAIKSAQALKQAVAGIGSTTNSSIKAFDIKPLTEYQAGILKIKQDALDLAKQKAEQAIADRTASLALQAALREERSIKQAANAADKAEKKEAIALAKEQEALQKKIAADAANKGKDRSFDKTAELASLKSLTASYGTLQVTQDRSVKSDNLQINSMNAKLVAYSKLSTEMAKEASTEGNLSSLIIGNTGATKENTKSQEDAYAKRKLAVQMLAEQKSAQAKATAELKNSVRESTAEKGSIEQRRAALVRLTTVYSNLTKAERESASGQRMAGIIGNLKTQIDKLDPTKIQKVSTELKKVEEAAPEGSFMSKLFSSIGEGALSTLAPLALLAAAWAAVKAIFSHNVEISDAFADVRRTAKLSADEVSAFAKELKGLDTRTALEGLLDIGFIGGRLAVPKKDLEDFVKQVDELAVVLKKEFPGGAEAVAESLGKIVTIYKVTQKEGVSLGTALSKVGSNLLELAHSGPVTVKYLQDFTLGVAGTAASAKLSIPVISAYGAVLGESGQVASSAALSVTRLVTGLTTKTGKYAAIAQLADSTLTVEKFTKIVNTDTKQALDLFFKGLKAGNPVATEFAARLGSVGITTGKVTNAVKILAENQDKLADRIQKGTTAFEDGTSVAHNFEIANDTLGASVDKLGNSITNLTTDPNSNMSLFFKGLIDGATKSVKGLSILIDTIEGLSTDPKKFIGDSAAKSRNAGQQQLEDDARKQAVIAIKNLGTQKESLDYLKQEVKIRDILQAKYLQEKIAYENIPLKDRSLAGTNKFDETETNFQKQIALVKTLNSEYGRLYRSKNVSIEGDGSLVDQEGTNRTIEDIKNDIKQLTDENKKLGTQTALFKSNRDKLIALRKELKIANGGKDTEGISAAKEYATALKSRNDLQAKIDDLIKKGTDKQLSSDDQEVESVKNKYASMREEAIKFNNAPENIQKGLRTDLGGIANAQKTEIAATVYKQDTAKLSIQLDKQKDLYAQYEQYKTDFGDAAAKVRFDKEIKTNRTLLENLEAQRGELLSKDPTDMTGAEKERLADFDKRINEEAKAQNAAHIALLVELKSYQEQVISINDKYAAKKKVAIEENTLTPDKQAYAIKLLSEQQAAEVDVVKESALEKSAAYQHLNEEVLRYSKSQLNAEIDAIEYTLKNATGMAPKLKSALQKELGELKVKLSLGGDDEAFVSDLKKKKAEIEQSISFGVKVDDNGNLSIIKLTTAEYKDQVRLLGIINGKIKETTAQKFEKLSSNLSQVSGAFDDIASIIPDTNAGLKDTFSALGEIAKVGSDAAGSVASFMSGDVIGGITKGVKALTGAISFFNRGKESAKKAAAELIVYQDDLLKNEITYNEAIRERARTLKDINSLSVKELITQQALLALQKKQAKSDYDRLLAQIQNSGQQITGSHIEKSGGFLGIGKKSTTVQDTAGISDTSYSNLEKLYLSGKLTDATKAWFEELQKAKTEAEAIATASTDAQDVLNQKLTATTASSISDAIIQGFKDGKRSAADFADDFKGLMTDAMYAALKDDFLDDAIADFYKRFAEVSKDGLTADETKDLQAQYQAIIAEGIKKAADIDLVTGALPGTKTPTGIQGTITSAGLTDESANKAMGLWRGQYDVTKTLLKVSTDQLKVNSDHYGIAVRNLTVAQEISANTLRTANNTEALTGMAIDIKKVVANTTTSAGDPFRNAGLNI